MKSFIVLTAVAVLTIGNAIAAMPGASRLRAHHLCRYQHDP